MSTPKKPKKEKKPPKPKPVYITTELDEYKRLYEIMNILLAQLHNANCHFIKKVPMHSAVTARALMSDLIEVCKLMKSQTHKVYNERRDQTEQFYASSFETRRKKARNYITSIQQETCVHCGVTMQMQNYRKYHGDRCKLNPNRVIK